MVSLACRRVEFPLAVDAVSVWRQVGPQVLVATQQRLPFVLISIDQSPRCRAVWGLSGCVGLGQPRISVLSFHRLSLGPPRWVALRIHDTFISIRHKSRSRVRHDGTGSHLASFRFTCLHCFSSRFTTLHVACAAAASVWYNTEAGYRRQASGTPTANGGTADVEPVRRGGCPTGNAEP